MARNWQYPRWRKLLMQSAMWLILGGTVGLAALLDRHQLELSQIALSKTIQCGGIKLELPAHWLIEPTDPTVNPGMLTATQPDEFPPRRILEVTVAPPAEVGLLDQLLEKDNPGPPQPVTFGTQPGNEYPGNLYTWEQQLDDDGDPRPFARVIATAALPNGPQVTLRLKHLARDEQPIDLEEDVDLVRRIAATVRLAPQLELPAPGQ